jgi:hypothetical protein
VALGIIEKYPPKRILTFCVNCFFPLYFYPQNNNSEIRTENIKKSAFLIHSAVPEDRDLLKQFRSILGLHGVATHIIEDDPRPIDFLQKSFDGIKNAQFTVVLLTKRYQFTNEKGLVGWKGADKCYDEIAMSFAFGRDIFAIVEKEVDPGRVLEARAWYYNFERDPLRIPIEFFSKLAGYLGSEMEPSL